MKRVLKDIIAVIQPVSVRGSLDVEINGLSYDAFTVRPGELFLATEGVNSDRHRYIGQVIKRGITAVVHSKPLPEYAPDVTYIQVDNVQRSMSPASAEFYRRPSRDLFVIGVTGTNGKSTTCAFIYQLLKGFSKKTGIISSVHLDTGGGLLDNTKHQSTPEAPIIQRALFEAVQNGLQFMVLETTSHGLSERTNRVGDVEYDVAVMTNVTHEHLEFHGTMERYIDDKANLFRLMSKYGGEHSFGVVNADDHNAESFVQASTKPVYSYGIQQSADYRGANITSDATSASFTVVQEGIEHHSQIGLPGKFNVSNALAAAITVINALGLPPGEVIDKLKSLQGIRGRMTPVTLGQPFRVVVDFAHTPDSFSKLLPEMKRVTAGRLFVLFGSAGERDTAKRPLQGSIASQYADVIVLTDEDPRGEDPMTILEEIAAGCRGHRRGETLLLIPNREEAILKAFQSAVSGDTVLLLGKGHEATISYSNEERAWDEIGMAEKCLNKLGYQ